MSYSGSLVSLNIFSMDDADYLNEDIYMYIKTAVFNSKADADLVTKDILNFVSSAEAVAAAKTKLNMNDYELIAFVVKYFNERATVKYHPLTLAKQIKKQLNK